MSKKDIQNMKKSINKYGYILYHKKYKRTMAIKNKENYENWENKGDAEVCGDDEVEEK